MLESNVLEGLDKFIEEDKSQKSSSVLLKKITEYLSQISSEKITFEAEFLGDFVLKSNFNILSNCYIKINCKAKENDIYYSNPTNKSTFRKFKEKILEDKRLIPTLNEVVLYLERLLKTEFDAKTFVKNNYLSIEYKNVKYVVFADYNIDKFFVLFKKKFNINLEELHKNLLLKNKETNGNFFKTVKFCKAVEGELMLKNYRFERFINVPYSYENIIFNVPNNLLNEKNVYYNYLNAITYLINSNEEEFAQADNEKLINKYGFNFIPSLSKRSYKNFIANNKFFIKNIEEILS